MTTRTDRIKTYHRTKMLLPGSSGVAVTSSGWTFENNGSLFLTNNKSNKWAIIPVEGLAVGDTIMAFRIVGAQGGASGSTSVLNVSLVKATKGTGTSGSTLVQAMTTSTASADASKDIETTLTTPLVLVDDYQYYFFIKGTTFNHAVADISIAGIEVDVKKTFGQIS